MAKIIISISGGVCQAVHSDDPNIEVEIYDWDNIRSEFEGDTEAGLPMDMEEAHAAYIAKEQQDYDLAILDMEQIA